MFKIVSKNVLSCFKKYAILFYCATDLMMSKASNLLMQREFRGRVEINEWHCHHQWFPESESCSPSFHASMSRERESNKAWPALQSLLINAYRPAPAFMWSNMAFIIHRPPCLSSSSLLLGCWPLSLACLPSAGFRNALPLLPFLLWP